MGIISKIKTLSWYLSRPSYYGQLFSLIRSKIQNDPKEKSRPEAEDWCRSNAIDTKTFAEKLDMESVDLKQKYPEIFNDAEERANNAPVKMGGPGNIDLIYALCESIQAQNILETGVAYGWSTLAILLSLKNRNDAKLISIDLPYAKMNNEDYVGCVVPEDLKNYWTLIREPDQKALPGAFAQMEILDLCHYDSDKSYQGRMNSYPKIWDHLRSGGIFISDDIGDNLAFKEFSEQLDQTPYVVQFRNQFVGVLIKP